MSAQLAKRRARIAAGEKPLGWKVGFGAPATMQKMGLTAPVVGYLMQRALLLSGSTASLERLDQASRRSRKSAYGWRMIFGRAASPGSSSRGKGDLPGYRTGRPRSVRRADNARHAVLEGNIFQRHVILCGNTTLGREHLRPDVTRAPARRRRPTCSTDPEALTGKLPDIVAPCRRYTLAAFGEKLTRRRRDHQPARSPRRIMIEPDENELDAWYSSRLAKSR